VDQGLDDLPLRCLAVVEKTDGNQFAARMDREAWGFLPPSRSWYRAIIIPVFILDIVFITPNSIPVFFAFQFNAI
jgi:hypothetical protein